MEFKKGDTTRIKYIRGLIDEIQGKKCVVMRKSTSLNFFDVKLLEGKLKGHIFSIMEKYLEVRVWSVS